MLFLLRLAVLSSCINLVESETQLECLINEHSKVGMLQNKKLLEVANADANKKDEQHQDKSEDKYHTEPLRPDNDPYQPGSIWRTCTRSYDKIMEKHLCNYFISTRLNTQLLNRAKHSSYVIMFGCVVGRQSDKVKVCCAKRTTKKLRNSLHY